VRDDGGAVSDDAHHPAIVAQAAATTAAMARPRRCCRHGNDRVLWVSHSTSRVVASSGSRPCRCASTASDRWPTTMTSTCWNVRPETVASTASASPLSISAWDEQQR
jgi:hypothetical protein